MFRLQLELLLSKEALVLAISMVADCSVSALYPGHDNFILTTDASKEWLYAQLVALLKDFINLGVYSCSFVKDNVRIENVSLHNVFTVIDRVVMVLLSFLISPIIEHLKDKTAFGYGQSRPLLTAIQTFRDFFRSFFPTHVLYLSIKRFLPSISHSWILANVPLSDKLKALLSSLLKSGLMLVEVPLSPITNFVMPLGVQGILPLLLADFTLVGLWEAVVKALPPRYVVGSHYFKTVHLISAMNTILFTIRLFPNNLVSAQAKIFAAISQFLEVRGLSISMFTWHSVKLGTRFIWLNHLWYWAEGVTALSKGKVVLFFRSAPPRTTVRRGAGADAINLLRAALRWELRSVGKPVSMAIHVVNEVLLEWYYWYSLGNISELRSSLVYMAFQALLYWLKRKFSKLSITSLYSTYVLNVNGVNRIMANSEKGIPFHSVALSSKTKVEPKQRFKASLRHRKYDKRSQRRL